MIVELGIVALFLALLFALLGLGLALWGGLRGQEAATLAARNAFLLTLPLLSVPALILIYAQVTGMYEIAYVSSVSKDTQPLTLKITALWGGQAGSLLLWSWMMSLFTVAVMLLNWRGHYRLMPWVMVAAGGTLLFFLILNNFYENPFARTWAHPDDSVEAAVLKPEGAILAYPYQSSQGQTYFREPHSSIPGMPGARYDGRGLNPLLRHPGMIIHPPLLYLGFTGFIIPFAFAVAALMRGEMAAGWIRATRRWSLVAWLFLSLGLVLGGRWAYDVLGWGGYWGWDPVENSSFLPWLTGTAFLHSVMIQEKRGMLKGWNMVMILLTYLLVLFGTVATRTGLLSSVHSFAQSPLAVPMGLFLGLTVLGCVALLIWRGNTGMFENDHQLESLFSRESLFLFNNWVFMALTVVVFWGTWAELITGLARDAGLMGSTINLGREYYETIVPWLFLVLFILMGVAPLAAWRKASAARLGLSLRGPLLLGLLAWLLSYWQHRDLVIGFGMAVVAFAGFATLQEFYKGAQARHQAHGESYPLALWRLIGRNRRRYGGYMIHLSIVVMGLGIIASSAFQEVRQETLAPGESIQVGSYTLQYNEIFEADAIDGRGMMIVNTTLYQDNQAVATLRPRRDFFDDNSSPMTIAGVHSTVANDVYVLLTFWENDRVTLRVYRNPLISFVWAGSFMLIIGTLVAVYPDAEKQALAQARPVPQWRRQTASAGD